MWKALSRTKQKTKKKISPASASAVAAEGEPEEMAGEDDGASDSGSSLSDGEVKNMIKALYKRQTKDATSAKKTAKGIATELMVVNDDLSNVTASVKKLDEGLDDRIDNRIKVVLEKHDGCHSTTLSAVTPFSPQQVAAAEEGFVPTYFRFGNLCKFEETKNNGPTEDQIVAYGRAIRDACTVEVKELLSFDAGCIICKFHGNNQFWWWITQPTDGSAVALTLIRAADVALRTAVQANSFSEDMNTYVNAQGAPSK